MPTTELTHIDTQNGSIATPNPANDTDLDGIITMLERTTLQDDNPDCPGDYGLPESWEIEDFIPDVEPFEEVKSDDETLTMRQRAAAIWKDLNAQLPKMLPQELPMTLEAFQPYAEVAFQQLLRADMGYFKKYPYSLSCDIIPMPIRYEIYNQDAKLIRPRLMSNPINVSYKWEPKAIFSINMCVTHEKSGSQVWLTQPIFVFGFNTPDKSDGTPQNYTSFWAFHANQDACEALDYPFGRIAEMTFADIIDKMEYVCDNSTLVCIDEDDIKNFEHTYNKVTKRLQTEDDMLLRFRKTIMERFHKRIPEQNMGHMMRVNTLSCIRNLSGNVIDSQLFHIRNALAVSQTPHCSICTATQPK